MSTEHQYRPLRTEDEKNTGTFQSVESTLRIMKHFCRHQGPNTLRDVAAATGLSPGTVERYLQSMVQEGLITQLRKSGHYGLGPLAVRLGMAALEQMDLVGRTCDHLDDLQATVGFPVHVAIWADSGPMVIRVSRTSWNYSRGIQIGGRTPVWQTATGRVFLAFLPRQTTMDILVAEAKGRPPSDGEVSQAISEIRRKCCCDMRGEFWSSVGAIAAPVVNTQNEIMAAVTILYPVDTPNAVIDICAERLLDYCTMMSVSDSRFFAARGVHASSWNLVAATALASASAATDSSCTRSQETSCETKKPESDLFSFSSFRAERSY